MTTEPGEEFIWQSATLRGQNKFDEAIAVIDENMNQISPTIKFNALNEKFQAAREKGDEKLAQKMAREMSKEHPNFPSIQGYL
ncbi:hypothetical protein KUV57_12625 [Epibacterium sp. DP7N7-1]|nr:hypothetical protein [Epibacterium sp. DP7N7-1]